ncbi:MAG: AtpZ/AtpI family protein [Thermoanaerobaculia bacterium]
MKRRRYDLGLAGLGIELAASVIGFTLLGLWIDRRWQTAPWAVVICASIGFVGGMYNFIRSAQKAARKAERRARNGTETEG